MRCPDSETTAYEVVGPSASKISATVLPTERANVRSSRSSRPVDARRKSPNRHQPSCSAIVCAAASRAPSSLECRCQARGFRHDGFGHDEEYSGTGAGRSRRDLGHGVHAGNGKPRTRTSLCLRLDRHRDTRGDGPDRGRQSARNPRTTRSRATRRRNRQHASGSVDEACPPIRQQSVCALPAALSRSRRRTKAVGLSRKDGAVGLSRKDGSGTRHRRTRHGIGTTGFSL